MRVLINTRWSLLVVIVFCQLGFGSADVRAQSRDMLTWNQIESAFVESFNVPTGSDGDFRFGFSTGVHCQLDNGNILLDGHLYFQMQAEIELPVDESGMANRVGDWFDISDGKLPDGWEPNSPAYLLGGMLQKDGLIYFAKYQWYNGSGANWQTQGIYAGDYSGNGITAGMFGVDGMYSHHSRVGGFISPAPQFLDSMGYDYLAGQQGTSGAAVGRWGPNMFAISYDDQSTNASSRPLICHDTEEHQVPNWWIANHVTSGIWLEQSNHHAVLFFVKEGLGEKWYGLSPSEQNNRKVTDPYSSFNGYHAEGWKLSAWLYDPDDLMQVFSGKREPWSLLPVEKVELVRRDPGSTDEIESSLFFDCPANSELKISYQKGRLIVMQPNGFQASTYERTPRGYVFDLNQIR